MEHILFGIIVGGIAGSLARAAIPGTANEPVFEEAEAVSDVRPEGAQRADIPPGLTNLSARPIMA